MNWLVLLFVVALLLLYVLIIRPILKQQPMLSAAFKAEASLWQQLQAKLTGFRTKLTARLLAIAGILVGFHDDRLRKITENPPHVILQKDDAGVPKVVAIEKPAS